MSEREIIILVFLAVVAMLIRVGATGRRHGSDRARRSRPKGQALQPARRRPAHQLRRPISHRSGTLSGRAWVIVGDTIAIKQQKIRLAGIDAPELDAPYGQKSKWAMVQICKGQTVTAHLTGETSYDRLVAVCTLPDGRDIGAELVAQGLALDFTRFSGGRYRHLEPKGVRSRLMWARHRADYEAKTGKADN
ncbi:thermonuclease family protein [Oceanomicrobium pacificus]|uniref:TNase-like domain-containing protein n=1 Tax=Oceanomicrobium pacificus TaxID=2692916 RepID=A0A6B0TL43_9RHOB|nr:thermonuclease family protein [Oceanomicrobium pacificus]MXU65250.1 hypothetical protein [Oceanomicrobium pacificus]